MLNYWGRDWSWSRAVRYCSDICFAHHSSIMHGYEAIPQRLLVNGLLCRAEKSMKTKKWKMERTREESFPIARNNVDTPDNVMKGGTTSDGDTSQTVQHAPFVTNSAGKKDATLSAQREQRSDSSRSRQQATPHHHHTKAAWLMTATCGHYFINPPCCCKYNNLTSKTQVMQACIIPLQLPVRGNPLPYLYPQVRAVMC